jgi:5-oxoprolinase (ATP-hydrolysing) subunit A
VLQTETSGALPLFQLDLSADVGEGIVGSGRSADSELLSLVSSASVACGGHAGDEDSMRRATGLALRLGVTVGAHPGYLDRERFGRRELDLPSDTVAAQVAEQIHALIRCAAAEGARVRYVKPHGALYNRAAREPDLAAAIAAAVRSVDPSLALLGLAGSALVTAARDAGLRGVAEAFLDRGYAAGGALVPRSQPGALVDDAGAVARRAVGLARDHEVEAVDGSRLQVAAESCCVHGDSPRAPELLRAARAALEDAGVTIAPFVV